MVHMHGVIKKWGNSFGVLIPKDVVRGEGLHEYEEVEVIVIPSSKKRLSEDFGRLKGKLRLTGQEVKDLARKELHD